MKKLFLLGLMAIIATATSCTSLAPKKIVVTPETAKIYVDGNYVGDGSYFVRFGPGNDFYTVKTEAPGYVTKQMRIYQQDTRNVIAVDLRQDDSIDGSVVSNLANQYFTIRVRAGVDEDAAWKLLTQVLLNYFNEIKTSDKSSGYMNTAWYIHQFPMAEVKVRTMVQIKQVTTGDGLTYQVRISSEIAPLDTFGQQGFKPWGRILKQYEPIINELQQRLS